MSEETYCYICYRNKNYETEKHISEIYAKLHKFQTCIIIKIHVANIFNKGLGIYLMGCRENVLHCVILKCELYCSPPSLIWVTKVISAWLDDICQKIQIMFRTDGGTDGQSD